MYLCCQTIEFCFESTRKCVYLQPAYTDTMKDFAAIDFETANGKRTSVCSVGGPSSCAAARWSIRLPPDPSPSQFLQPFHDGHPRSALMKIRLMPRFRVGVARNRTPCTRGCCSWSTTRLRRRLPAAVFELYGMPSLVIPSISNGPSAAPRQPPAQPSAAPSPPPAASNSKTNYSRAGRCRGVRADRPEKIL